MNVSFERMSTSDAARIIGVDKTSVTSWCAKNIINFSDVSNGVNKSRYEIPEDEVFYLRDLYKEYGKRKAMKHYDKNHNVKPVICNNPIEEEVTQVPLDMTSVEKAPAKFDADKMLTTILYIQDIKERLEDLDAEKNQLLNELAQLKQEVIEQL